MNFETSCGREGAAGCPCPIARRSGNGSYCDADSPAIACCRNIWTNSGAANGAECFRHTKDTRIVAVELPQAFEGGVPRRTVHRIDIADQSLRIPGCVQLLRNLPVRRRKHEL